MVFLWARGGTGSLESFLEVRVDVQNSSLEDRNCHGKSGKHTSKRYDVYLPWRAFVLSNPL